MTQPYFDYDKYTDVFKKWQGPLQAWQEPIQELIDLNTKTLQAYQYIKPEELSTISKPEDFIEKQLELAIANGHKGLDYLKQSFDIMEKTMLACAKEAKSAKKS